MDMVFVGCKLPHGLVLELTPKVDEKDFLKPQPAGKRVTLSGACSLFNRRTVKVPSQYDFAVTPVEKSFWEAWIKDHRDMECVKNGMVFVTDKAATAAEMAKERAGSTTIGIEPLSGQDDPRNKHRAPDPSFSEFAA